MAQAGYTPIQLYYSSTTTNAPSAGNLASGELAINITDGKLFYKDNGGSVQVIAWKTTPTTAGGTGLTSWTAGDLPYYATGTTLSKLGIGTNGQILTSTGTAPQWSTLSGVAVTTFSAGTTGFTPSSPTSGAVTLGGTLATTNGGTGLTSFTANGVVYASSSSALTTGSALTFDGTILTTSRINITNTGTGATFSSSGGSGMRIYGSSGTNQWDLYLNGANVRFSDNTGGGKFVVDTDATIYGVTVGRGAGAVSTNTAVGASALAANTSGANNTTVGQEAGLAVTSGAANVAVGQQALRANQTGNDNTALGRRALYFATGSNNTAVGSEAGISTTTGAANTSVGAFALASNTTASNNTAVGYQAGYANTTGTNNAFFGRQAGYATTTGVAVTAIGDLAAYSNTTGQITAVGYVALTSNTTASANTGVGVAALRLNTTGAYNTALGDSALYSNTTASNNTAVGYQAGYSNVTGPELTAVGYQALKSSTGGYNTAVGFQAGLNQTSGDGNTYIGRLAAGTSAGVTGSDNTGIGNRALQSLTSGAYNTALGGFTLQANTTASNNTAVGYQAGYSNVTGTGQAFFGQSAGYNATGGYNTLIGQQAGTLITSGTKNTVLGRFDGNQGGLDIRTANNHIVLSDGDGNPQLFINATPLLVCPPVYNNTAGGAANVFVDSSGGIYRSTSSLKYKRDVQDAAHGLAEIMQLRSVTYKGKSETDGDTVFGGLIAEEVHAIGLSEFVMYSPDGSPDGLAYGNMVSLCIKAIQELKTELDTVKSELATLKGA